MIQVSVRQQTGKIVSVEVSGHAESAEYGRDLVCAAVSAVVIGLNNALDELLKEYTYEFEENRICIGVKTPDERSELILRTGLIQLESIAEAEQDYVSIEFMEV